MAKTEVSRDRNINLQSAMKLVIEYSKLVGLNDLSFKELFQMSGVVADKCMYDSDDIKPVVIALDLYIKKRLTKPKIDE